MTYIAGIHYELAALGRLGYVVWMKLPGPAAFMNGERDHSPRIVYKRTERPDPLDTVVYKWHA